MDLGASSYRRYLDGDDTGLTEIIRIYKDGLALYINPYDVFYHELATYIP